MPYLVITSAQLFKYFEHGSARFYKAVFCLAMANSGVNPLIYAWKNSAFRRAFGKLLRCQRPDGGGADQEQIESMRSAAARKSSSMIQRQDTFNSTRTLDFGTPPSSARPRTNSSDSASTDQAYGGGGYGIGAFHGSSRRGSIGTTDSGCVVVMKHKRLSSLSSEHRYSQTTISEETVSNHTTVVMFSSQEVESSDVETTPRKEPPRKEIPAAQPTRNAKLIRNKCAILESFDSVSDDSQYSEYDSRPPTQIPPPPPLPPQSLAISTKSIFNFKHVFAKSLSSSAMVSDAEITAVDSAPKKKSQSMNGSGKQQTMAYKVKENFETVVCKL